MSKIAKLIDHTCLKPDASAETIEKLCEEALEYGFYSVCVNPYYVRLAEKKLSNSTVRICSVVGFPLGATTKKQKAFEASELIKMGAHELDMVINIAAIKEGENLYASEEISEVKAAAGAVPLKVIIETGLLTYEEKIRACEAVVKAGAQFIKTCTGFSNGTATLEDIKLIRETAGALIGIKASGGIKSYETAIALVEAGATRIGSSQSVAIVQEEMKVGA